MAFIMYTHRVTVDEVLSPWKEVVDQRLEVLLPSANAKPERLHAAMRYSCLAPGKRLRPTLLLACAKALTADVHNDFIDAACAVEMVHCFSLIHDDLPAIDDDDLRRGRPTCHKVFGEGLAILAGDALFALAFETMAQLGGRVTRVLARASGSSGLVGGEVIDIESEGSSVDEGTVTLIHERKTGALVAAACEIGAILAGADEVVIEKFARFGAKIGLAFQIADDLLNESSSPEQLGKASGSDRLRGKATYPAVFGVATSVARANTLIEESINELGELATEELKLLAKFAHTRDS